MVLALCSCSCSQPQQGSVSPSAMPGSPTSSASPSPVVSTVAELLARCPSPAELTLVDSSLSMTFSSDPSAGQLVCHAENGSRDLTLLQERSYQAILLFTWVRFDAPLPWTAQNLDVWFAHAIHGVAFRGDAQTSYCCDPGGVIVIQTNNLWVLTSTDDPRPMWDEVRSLAALFVHEARHNEGYGHTCGMKDNTVAELGAWGVEYDFLLWLGTHSDPAVIPEPFRSQAAVDASGMLRPDAFFCSPQAQPSI